MTNGYCSRVTNGLNLMNATINLAMTCAYLYTDSGKCQDNIAWHLQNSITDWIHKTIPYAVADDETDHFNVCVNFNHGMTNGSIVDYNGALAMYNLNCGNITEGLPQK